MASEGDSYDVTQDASVGTAPNHVPGERRGRGRGGKRGGRRGRRGGGPVFHDRYCYCFLFRSCALHNACMRAVCSCMHVYKWYLILSLLVFPAVLVPTPEEGIDGSVIARTGALPHRAVDFKVIEMENRPPLETKIDLRRIGWLFMLRYERVANVHVMPVIKHFLRIRFKYASSFQFSTFSLVASYCRRDATLILSAWLST